MNKIIGFAIIFLFSILNKSLSETNIYIFATIDDEVITNHDVKKESLYLKKQLNYIQLLKIYTF